MQFLESAYLVSNSDEQKFNTTGNNLFDAIHFFESHSSTWVRRTTNLQGCFIWQLCWTLLCWAWINSFFSNQETGTDIGEIGSQLSSSLSLIGYEEQTSPIEPNQKLSTSVTRNERCLPSSCYCKFRNFPTLSRNWSNSC